MEVSSEVSLWAIREFDGAQLGDVRRTQRLVNIAEGMAINPEGAISACCGKSGAQAVSRFFAREEVDLDSVMQPHIAQTRSRCQGNERILAVQDTTTLNFTTHKSKKGLGPITTSENSRGVLQHTVLIVNSGKTPLGVGGVWIWARDEENRGCAKDRRQRLVCDKESNKWLIGLKQAENAVPEECELVVIGDRESDVYALFAAERRPNTHLLVRFAHNRAVVDEEHKNILEAVENAESVGAMLIHIPRKPGKVARDAWLELKACSVMLKPPQNRTPDVPDTPVRVWVVQAEEVNVPDGEEGVSWTLITTEPVEDLEGASRAVKEYESRWVIEEFHRVLKSGCEVEKMQLDDVDSLIPAIGVSSIVAWRILHMTKLAREEPDMDASTISSSKERVVLEMWLKSQREKKTDVTTTRDFVRAVALLGGFMGRKSDGEPGTKVIWQGMKRLEDLLIGYRLATGQEIR